jgi:DNA-binding GntR family transcriptional regulator
VIAGSAVLIQLILQLSQKIVWVYSIELPRRAAESWREHEEICDALEAADPERAPSVVARHIALAQAAYQLRERGSGQVG